MTAQTIYAFPMRKWIASLLFLLLALAFVYLFIPSTVSVDERTDLPVNAKAFSRIFLDEKTWWQWWPGDKPANTTYPLRFTYNGKAFTLLQKRFASYVVSVSEGRDSLLTELVLIPLQNGTPQATWVSTAVTGSNPFTRIKRYWQMKNTASDIRSLLQQLRSFYGTGDRLYGFPIKEGLVTDSLLVSTVVKTKKAPTTQDVYTLVDRLQAFAKKKGATQMNPPMLNVFRNTDSSYSTRVALPVSKRLADEGDIQFKWMLGNGNILITEVKGGPAQIQRAFAQMRNYVEDNMRTAPAIEFQSLITDRRAEPDTNKWITKLYWPVM